MLAESGRNGLRELLCHGSLSPGATALSGERPQPNTSLSGSSQAADLKQS